MQTYRQEFFIKRDFGFYDTGILGCLPDVAFNIYEILRRYVWRSIETGNPDSRRLYAEHKLATMMSQAEIANALDRDRKTINGHIAGMKELGWLKVIPDPDGLKPATYILGERVKDTVGRYHEVFFADAWMKALYERIELEAQRSGPEGKVSQLSWDRRREICREFMALNSEPDGGQELDPRVQKTDNPVSEFLDRGCPEKRTGEGGGVSRKTDTEREKSFQDISKKRTESTSPVPRTRERSHWSKPSKRERLTPTPAADDDLKSSAPGVRPSDTLVHRLEAVQAVAKGAPPALDPQGEGHLAKADRAHDALRKREEARQARRNLKSVDEDSIKEAHRYIRRVWEGETEEAFGAGYPSFGPKEYEQLDTLLASYTQAQIAGGVSYVVRQWSALRKRVLKNDHDKLTFSFLWRFHALVFAESADYLKVEQVHREWRAWFDAHPDDYPPDDLKQRYNAIKPQLKAMGLAS